MMPWQRMVADVIGEVDAASGRLAYREAWVSVPRQQGKTTLVLSTETERCITWTEPQRVAYTAQTGFEAKTKLLEDQVPMVQASPLGRFLAKVRRAQGDWGVDWAMGSRIDVIGSSGSAGHGRVIDLGVLDEAWKDDDDRREQAILPAMVTRPDAQLLGVSTMGTDASLYLNRKVAAGREAAAEDSGSGLAYFEWSVPEDADVDDPEVWWAHMPALGWTITEDAVRHARETMEDGEFRRAFGNQQTKASERVIPEAVWLAVQDADAAPQQNIQFGVDVNADRTGAAIVASDGEAVEMVAAGDGTQWVVGWFTGSASRAGTPVVVAQNSPAGSLVDDLERAGVRVRAVAPQDEAAAAGRFYDAVADARLRVRPVDGRLDEAVAGAAVRRVGDRFVWSRQQSAADVSPLIAATLAFGARGRQREPRIRVIGGE